MRVFIAGGVNSAGNRAYLESIAQILEGAGYQVFLPHRDGNLPGKTGNQKGLLTQSDISSMGQAVFTGNLEIIRSSDAIVTVLDGLCWGTTVELGYAYAYKTLVRPQFIILGIYTDPIGSLDIMRHHACDRVVREMDALPGILQQLADQSCKGC